MKGGFLLAGLGGVLVLGGCAAGSRVARTETTVPLELERRELYQIGSYQGKEEGEAIPPWVEAHLGGEPLEALWGYEGKYLFIAENSGPNDRLLRQWAENFSPLQDFPRLAAMRIELRFTRAALGYPDDEYGVFFPLMIRAASDGVYEGVEREADFWIQRWLLGEDGMPADQEEYRFLILVSVDKFLFERRVHDMLGQIAPDPSPTREQAAAIRRVLDIFFDGF
jgi:hypothetical protein